MDGDGDAGDGTGRRSVAFRVSDTGVGISDDNLQRIFGAFQQGDGTTSRRYGGTGLGLSISREVATLLGGTIRVSSEFGQGSTFTLLLPVSAASPTGSGGGSSGSGASGASSGSVGSDGRPGGTDRTPPDGRPRPAETAVPAPRDPDVHRDGLDVHRDDLNVTAGTPVASPATSESEGRWLLVVEPTGHGLLSLLARRAAADVTETHGPVWIHTASDPEEALRELSVRPARCVVLDLTLPDASAFAFLERLHGRPDLRDVPVLAHPTQKLGAAHERLAQTRFRNQRLELLPSLDELRERITLHLSADSAGDVMPLLTTSVGMTDQPLMMDTDSSGALNGRKILLIDDDVRNVFAITSMLELYGLIILQAPNGREGIQRLLQSHPVDLILMDLMMPEMDGYATMAAIRKMERFADLPIIAVTAKAMQSDREKCLAAGATDFITKPVDAEMLLRRMREVIAGR
jgi:CheY-like chemotaxis protein